LPDAQTSPFDALLEEIEISPQQIADFKVQYHQTFLRNWIQQKNSPLSLDQVWLIRESCIAALANNSSTI